MPTLQNSTSPKKKSKTKARKELVNFIIEKLKEISLASDLSSASLTYRDVLIIATRLQNEDCLNQSLFFTISQLLAVNDTQKLK
jgi:hypothetical protein